MLAISYCFDTNRSSRSGMRFDFVETHDAPTASIRNPGPAFNGITPSTDVVVDNSNDAFAFIDARVGRSWKSWSLWYVMPDSGQEPYYRLEATMLSEKRVRAEMRCPVQRICGRLSNGEKIDAQVSL